jgi:hypothetical protein
MRPMSLTLAAVLLASAASAARGVQPNVAGRELVGLVRDARGAALEAASVEIPGAAARTDVRGAFRLYTVDLDTVTITIRRLGYGVVSALLSTNVARRAMGNSTRANRSSRGIPSARVKCCGRPAA